MFADSNVSNDEDADYDLEAPVYNVLVRENYDHEEDYEG